MTELERALLDASVAWPETPDLAAAVRARLEAEPVTRPRTRRRRPRLAWLAALVVLAGGGTLAASPAARSDVLRWLGLESVEVRRGPVPRPPLGRALDLGTPTTLAEADRRANLAVRVPPAVGAPGVVYLSRLPDGTRAVSLLYAPRPGLPVSDVTGVALLVQVFRARVEPFIRKTIGSADRVQRVTVAGARGYWLEGAHGFAYTTASGVSYERQRLADSTLLVERDGLLVRVEGRMSRARAQAIAAGVLG